MPRLASSAKQSLSSRRGELQSFYRGQRRYTVPAWPSRRLRLPSGAHTTMEVELLQKNVTAHRRLRATAGSPPPLDDISTPSLRGGNPGKLVQHFPGTGLAVVVYSPTHTSWAVAAWGCLSQAHALEATEKTLREIQTKRRDVQFEEDSFRVSQCQFSLRCPYRIHLVKLWPAIWPQRGHLFAHVDYDAEAAPPIKVTMMAPAAARVKVNIDIFASGALQVRLNFDGESEGEERCFAMAEEALRRLWETCRVPAFFRDPRCCPRGCKTACLTHR